MIKKYFFEWEKVKHGVLQDSIFGPLFVLLHINDQPEIISDISNPTLFADDTNMIMTNYDLQVFKTRHKLHYYTIKQMVKSNLFLLNLE
jgi:hypothetical protein